MDLKFVKGFFFFIVLMLVQALVFNHIHLFGCATPLIYVYMVLLYQRGYPKWAILLTCFLMGLSIDLFANTPGVAAASMTFVGLLQPYVLKLFVTRDSPDDLWPSMKSLGATKFFYYTFILVFIYCIVFFTLETFSFFNFLQWVENVGGSTVLTILLILAMEGVRKN